MPHLHLTEDQRVTLEILNRLHDYGFENPTQAKQRLVQLWHEHFPQAAGEQSDAFRPLIRWELWRKVTADDPDEIWFNDVYHVTVRRHSGDPVFGTYGGMIQLGINTHEGTARHDWRDFQAIKNQIAGAETEAFELYPADSRLIDPSNYYTLWCFPDLGRIKVGLNFRRVRDADEALAAQRRMPPPTSEDLKGGSKS
jgi:hypothetical protein